MIPDISQEVLEKIANPIQLPANNGDPHLRVIALIGTQTDISNYIESGTISSKYDDYIYNLTLNIYAAPYTQDPTNFPFKPGIKLMVYIYFGNDSSASIPLCVAYIDEVTWTAGQETFSVSGRNNIGHFLKETQMGELIEVSGLSHEVIPEILEHAGVYSYYVTEGTFEWTYQFRASDSAMTALEEVCKMFPIIRSTDEPGFRIAELPDGHVLIGYPALFHQWLPTETYSFSAGRDCFSRSFRLNSDNCYSYVYANGKDDEGIDLAQVILPVENHVGWSIPANKIYFADFNGPTDQATLHEWAERVVMDLQTPGDTEEYSGPIRPQITVGDIGVVNGETIVNGQTVPWSKTGVITSITHHVGAKGFTTDFTIDSGGVYNAVSGWSSTMRAYGYNRRQKMADMVHEMTEITAQEVVNRNDPIVVQTQEYDDETGEFIIPSEERNKIYVRKDPYNFWDWPGVVTATGGRIPNV